ncbi:hypothetical protein EX30DRAFT_121637 [Ascodesmis nigricans]|uniref:Uncharacterized protein n=1 Tax=Ascodesmis nigricans TaxID=341454 RepID=A0A4V6RHC9_9PEZI|nr:hypothetical protein EX30DRAFT_121637 [Ascodesmis nigricans]
MFAVHPRAPLLHLLATICACATSESTAYNPTLATSTISTASATSSSSRGCGCGQSPTGALTTKPIETYSNVRGNWVGNENEGWWFIEVKEEEEEDPEEVARFMERWRVVSILFEYMVNRLDKEAALTSEKYAETTINGVPTRVPHLWTPRATGIGADGPTVPRGAVVLGVGVGLAIAMGGA